MKGFDVTSEYDMGTDDGSMQWNITLENTGGNYIEFGDVGLPSHGQCLQHDRGYIQ